MNRSPLFEKRITISLIKKHLFGRRAYSDSMYINKKTNSSNSIHSHSPTSTQCSTPHSEVSMADIELKAFGGIGC